MTNPKKKSKVVYNKGYKKQKQPENSAEIAVNEVRDVDEHPLQNGHFLVIKYRDESHRLARIIDKSGKSDNEISWRYYVHYEDFNRRMDEWIGIDRIVMLPSEANIIGKPKTIEDIQGDESADPGCKRPLVIKNGSDENAVTTIAEDDHNEHEGMEESQLKEHEEITKVKNIANVMFGKYDLECWYFSPYPKEFYPDGPVEYLYICEFSFRFFRTKNELIRYQSKSSLQRHPPGNEIYRDSHVSMFEVDGGVEKVYCQNLSYFAKLFLDHKTLYFDVDPFLFYVLCTQDDRGYHPVGYFSKEKYSDPGYNLACILTFPCVQRMGYGRFLIAFSYELSKKEEKVGSPEKPLSDLGAVSYRSYWASTLLMVLRTYPGSYLSIMDLAKMTSIVAEDVTSTLQHLNLLRNINGTYIIYASPQIVDDLMVKYPVKGLLVDPERLHWTPLYVTDPRKDKWSISAKRES